MSIEVCSRCEAQEDTDFIIGSYDDKGYICSDCVEGMEESDVCLQPLRQQSKEDI